MVKGEQQNRQLWVFFFTLWFFVFHTENSIHQNRFSFLLCRFYSCFTPFDTKTIERSGNKSKLKSLFRLKDLKPMNCSFLRKLTKFSMRENLFELCSNLVYLKQCDVLVRARKLVHIVYHNESNLLWIIEISVKAIQNETVSQSLTSMTDHRQTLKYIDCIWCVFHRNESFCHWTKLNENNMRNTEE